MAETIKGINIIIGSDTTGLSKALSDVNKKSRDIQSELRQVEKLLKLDPTNTELLAQKQKLLSDAIANTSEKLNRLKSAQEQVNQQFQRGEISEGQYRAFQREIIKTEQELQKLEQQGQETKRSLADLGVSLQNAGDKLRGVGQTMTLAVTTPIVGAGAAAFKMAADLKDAIGATEQIFKGAADSVKNWADGLAEYYGISEGEALEYANMMGALLQNIGKMSADEAAKQAQILVQLAGDLTAMFGGTTEQAVQALTGALKGNTEMLDNYGIACNDALIKTKALEMGIYDGKGEMDLAAKQAAILALIMEQTSAAQGQAAREADGASGSMRAFTTEIKNIATDIGEVLLPVITPLLNSLGDIVKKFSELSPETQKTIVIITGLAAAIGPLLLILGPVVSAIGTLVTGLGAMSAAMAGGASIVAGLTAGFPALGAAITLITGPIGIAVAAIAGLTAGGIALYKHLQKDSIPEIQRFGDEVSESTQKAVGAFLDLNDQATVALNQLSWSGQTVTQEMANNITSIFDQMGDQVLTAMQEDHAQQLQSMQEFFAQSSSLTEQEEAAALEKMKKHQQEQQQVITDGQKRIAEILQKAADEKRALTEKEKQEINRIQQEMVNTGIQVLSESELEQKAILERMKANAATLSAQQAAEVVRNSKKQKDEAIKAAEEQYNEVVKEIIRQRDEVGSISKEQADKLIQEATRQRDEAIKKAEEMHQKVIEEAKKQAEEHVDKVNWETGEVLTKWETFKNSLTRKWDEIKTKAASVWESTKKAITKPIEEAKETILDIIEKIKSAFANMKITIPKPKLPHITVSTAYKSIGGISIPYPDFDIDWYAQGGIFTRPSIIGVGEAGPEAVVPLDKAGAIGGVTVNMYGPVNIRDDSDIQKIARELFNLQQRAARARGLA